MLFIDLKPIFLLRGIDNPHVFLINSGISRHSAADLIHGNTRALRLDHLEILCDVLHCGPQDIFSFTPSANKHYADGHPLFKLVKEKISESMRQTIATMPLQELKELREEIEKRKNG